ncbi:hypothetical protein BT96DRAFT_919437 [Gymnopus androsaceus JB14]|uniref:Uncharacterized protein n=1 Tax=Gymnopus androsaceus JB14 TaxID=1447944 RepID=A0A6A4HSA2_9AGAR|nr:hypothetical protein BT96DRAFT_919437 [Gymnopus androsaceus JB14]
MTLESLMEPEVGQIIAQDIYPIASSPIAWTLTFTISALIILLRCIFFPCITLQGLKSTIQTVDQLLKEYHSDLFSSLPIRAVKIPNKYTEYREHLLRIENSALDISLGNRSARKMSWMKYLSIKRIFSRLHDVSSCYKKAYILQRKIKHSRDMISKRRNSSLIELIVLQRGDRTRRSSSSNGVELGGVF